MLNDTRSDRLPRPSPCRLIVPLLLLLLGTASCDSGSEQEDAMNLNLRAHGGLGAARTAQRLNHAHIRPSASSHAHGGPAGATCSAEQCATADVLAGFRQPGQAAQRQVAANAVRGESVSVADAWWKVSHELWTDVHSAAEFDAEVNQASSDYVLVGEPIRWVCLPPTRPARQRTGVRGGA